MKRVAIYAGGFLLFFLILWKSWHAYYEPRKREAMHFCEALIPEIEAAKRRDGKYPGAIDPKWFEGKKIPQLVRPNEFYDSRDDMYRFHFRSPGDFMDDVWGYQCGPQQPCVWQNYDENRR
jgi:hypothetical protein